MRLFIAAMLMVPTLLAHTHALAETPAQGCASNDGQYLTGTVTRKPYWVRASETIDGVQLSHTHITIRADSDSKLYDVAIDNVFNPTWVKNSSKVPSNLTSIAYGTHVALCGLLYTSGSPGIHWVHDSCGNTSSSNPNGFTEIVTQGAAGANLEASETYCYLFN